MARMRAPSGPVRMRRRVSGPTRTSVSGSSAITRPGRCRSAVPHGHRATVGGSRHRHRPRSQPAAPHPLPAAPAGPRTPTAPSTRRLARHPSNASSRAGQWQKPALARTMMRRQPLILLLDDDVEALAEPRLRDNKRRAIDGSPLREGPSPAATAKQASSPAGSRTPRSPASSLSATRPSRHTSRGSSPSSTYTTAPKQSCSPTRADSSNRARPPQRADSARSRA
jgi:hypothetical protein